MLGLIQDHPLLLSGVLSHAARHHADTPIWSRRRDGSFVVSAWGELDRRVRRLASALTRAGIRHGDRVSTLAWNNHQHLEIYFAASAIGAVCHPINPRLFKDQAVWIAQHAEDRALFYNREYADIAAAILMACPALSLTVSLDEERSGEPFEARDYEELLEDGRDDFVYPEFDERTAASLCYTSGTTGNPKGVLSTHRALVLHAMGARTADLFDLSPRSVAMAVVPLYHAHASWGLPFAAAMSGAALVLPGLQLDGAGLTATIHACSVTVANGVPTIWQGLVENLARTGQGVPTLGRIVIAGSAPAATTIEALEVRHGVTVCHIWGMTETGPCGTSGALHAKASDLPPRELFELKRKQGHGLFGLEMRMVGEDGSPLTWNGNQVGYLQVRGPFVISGYFKGDGGDAVTADRWFRTGDIACIDEDGYLRLVDRDKDLVKSGGEWISSIDVENAALGHPGVRDAAVIAVPHERWGERPLLIAVRNPDLDVTEAELIGHLADKIARWWLPDAVVFVDELPRTGTGKLMKTELRTRYPTLPSENPPMGVSGGARGAA